MTCVLQPFIFHFFIRINGKCWIFFLGEKGAWMDQRRGIIEGDVVFLCLNSTKSWDEFSLRIIFFVFLFIWRVLFCTQPAGLVNKACAHMISHSNSFVYVKESMRVRICIKNLTLFQQSGITELQFFTQDDFCSRAPPPMFKSGHNEISAFQTSSAEHLSCLLYERFIK